MALSRFAVAGVFNTGVTYVIYLLLLMFMPYAWAYSVTYVIGLAIGYALNAYWVFKTQPSAKSAAMYPVAYIFNYLLGLLLLRTLVESLGVSTEIAPLLVIVATVPLMYLMMKFVFCGRSHEQAID